MSKLLNRTMLAMAAVASCAWASMALADDKQKLEGQYTVTSWEMNGQQQPATNIQGCTFRITSDKIVAAAKDGKEFLNATYTLDTSKKPCQITLKSADSGASKTYQGLIERSGDTVQLIYALEGGEVPTAFKTKNKQVLYTLKSQK